MTKSVGSAKPRGMCAPSGPPPWEAGVSLATVLPAMGPGMGACGTGSGDGLVGETDPIDSASGSGPAADSSRIDVCSVRGALAATGPTGIDVADGAGVARPGRTVSAVSVPTASGLGTRGGVPAGRREEATAGSARLTVATVSASAGGITAAPASMAGAVVVTVALAAVIAAVSTGVAGATGTVVAPAERAPAAESASARITPATHPARTRSGRQRR